MSQQLISHSPDLKQLRDEGYELEIKGGQLIVHQIPYVNFSKEIKRGVFVCSMDLANPNQAARPKSHVMYFVGEAPCDSKGVRLDKIINSSGKQKIGEINVDHLFSSKPSIGHYKDYYEKVSTYSNILVNEAKSINPDVTAKTFRIIQSDEEDSVFQYFDTNSSRANIDRINSKLKDQKIAIIGLGGTGAYILDLVAKTPVGEIHLYDGDDFLLHNAFRSPGAPSKESLEKRKMKTDYYSDIYSNMHKGVISHPYYIDEYNISEFENISFVFLAIDRDAVKREIIEYLLEHKIPFVDVGLGVNVVDDKLIGTIRTTTGTPEKHDHLFNRISCGEDLENEYSTNIQIAELNLLNAGFAVLKWKKLFGFYQDLKEEHDSSFVLNVSQLQNNDTTA